MGLLAESNGVAPTEVAAEAPRSADAPLRSGWIWTGLALALIGRMLSMGRPDRTPGLWILAFFLPPYSILTYWAYTCDTGGARPLLRGLRAALFAFLAVEAFYWGVSIGGLAAAVGAYMIFTRFIRPRKASAPG